MLAEFAKNGLRQSGAQPGQGPLEALVHRFHADAKHTRGGACRQLLDTSQQQHFAISWFEFCERVMQLLALLMANRSRDRTTLFGDKLA